MCAHRLDRGSHCRPRRQAVVHQHDSATGKFGGLSATTVRPLPPGELRLFPLGDGVDDLRRNAQVCDDVLVEDSNAAGGDRTHRQLFVAGDTELAHDESIGPNAEPGSDLGRHHHPTAGQAEHHQVGGLVTVDPYVRKVRGENPAGVGAVGIAVHESTVRRLRLPGRAFRPGPPPPGSVSNVTDLTRVDPEVAAALNASQPVVALESTIISHGLPRPDNLRIAREIEAIVRKHGATPATIALLDGEVRIGLDEAGLLGISGRPTDLQMDGKPGTDVAKVSVRDLAPALAMRRAGATTVAATAYLAHRAGVHILATGGLGGVHREAALSWDESADLYTLAETPITVVCAGVKSILDVPATLERMESLSIGVVGFRTDRFPGFYLTDSGEPVQWRADSPQELAAIAAARHALAVRQALVVVNPLRAEEQLDPTLHDRVLAAGLAAAHSAGITGKDVTPYLLSYFHEQTNGASLEANIRLVLNNAALAADIAVASSRLPA